jgi:hypothetical protein
MFLVRAAMFSRLVSTMPAPGKVALMPPNPRHVPSRYNQPSWRALPGTGAFTIT